MIKTRATTTTVSLLALTMSVYVCLPGAVNVRALAQKSAAIVVAVQSQGLKPATRLAAQIERPVVAAASQKVGFSAQNESRDAQPYAARATFCALLSKYLSLS